MQGSSIELWVSERRLQEQEKDEGAKAAFPRFGRSVELKPAIESVTVDADALSANLKQFLSSFEIVLEAQPESISGFQLDEIELSLGVNATGGIALLGKIEAGVEASIKVKLKRRSNG